MQVHRAPASCRPFLSATLALFATAGTAADPVGTAPATGAHAEATRWFRDARFGLFIHWGVYAVPAGTWKGREIPGIGEWIMRHAKIPLADYQPFAQRFTAAKYDPSAWAALAKEAGVRYVVITAKHHDGFALYDSAVTDWDVAGSSPAGKDLLGPLASAVRGQGIRFGCYYSHSQDWNHPGGAGNTWDPAQVADYDDYLKKIAYPQVQEILTRFAPEVLWWDTPMQMTKERAQPFADLLASHPEVITNNRLGGGFGGDTRTPEQNIPPRGFPGEMFEVCMTMNDTWGYKTNDHHWKSVRQLVRNLSDIASKGGNFLLNIGPTAEGEIPTPSIERLKAVGAWMRVNGEAIYGTEAGPFVRRLPWGRVTRKSAADGRTTLFLHVWDWPADGRLVLPGITERPVQGRVLADQATFNATVDGGDLVLALPGAARDPDVSVLALTFAGPVAVKADTMPGADAQGEIVLTPTDADAHGNLNGNLQVVGSGPQARFGEWKDAGWRLEYQLKTPAAGRWTVVADIAAAKPATLTLTVGAKEGRTIVVPATGDAAAGKPVPIAVVDLPAGETTLGLVPVKDGWTGFTLGTITLTPAK